MAFWKRSKRGEESTYRFVNSAALVANILKSMAFGPKVRYVSRFVDEERVSKVKQAYADDPDRKFPFLSTNDVVTSSLCNATNSRLCISAINLRNRIEGLTNEDAGNYEFVLLLDEAHYRRPEDVRRTPTGDGPPRANDGVLPGVWEALRSNFPSVTNAASFIDDYRLGEREQLVHIPIFDPASVPTDVAVIYKARGGRRAILFFGKRTPPERHLEHAELGETVCESVFPGPIDTRSGGRI